MYGIYIYLDIYILRRIKRHISLKASQALCKGGAALRNAAAVNSEEQ